MRSILVFAFSAILVGSANLPHHLQATKRIDCVADDTSARHGHDVETESSLTILIDPAEKHLRLADSSYRIDSVVHPGNDYWVLFTKKDPAAPTSKGDTLDWRFDIRTVPTNPGHFQVVVRGAHWIIFNGESVYNTGILYYFDCVSKD